MCNIQSHFAYLCGCPLFMNVPHHMSRTTCPLLAMEHSVLWIYIKFRGAPTYFTNTYILWGKGVNSTRTDSEYYSRSKYIAQHTSVRTCAP